MLAGAGCSRDTDPARTRQCEQIVELVEAAYGVDIYWPQADDDRCTCRCYCGGDYIEIARNNPDLVPIECYPDGRKRGTRELNRGSEVALLPWREEEVIGIALALQLYEAELGREATRDFAQGLTFVRAPYPATGRDPFLDVRGELWRSSYNIPDFPGGIVWLYNRPQRGIPLISWFLTGKLSFGGGPVAWTTTHELAHQLEEHLKQQAYNLEKEWRTEGWRGDDNPQTGPSAYSRQPIRRRGETWDRPSEDIAESITTYLWDTHSQAWQEPRRFLPDQNPLGYGRANDRDLTAERRAFIENLMQSLRGE